MSTGSENRRTDELRGRHRRIRRTALLVSLILHLVLFLIFRGELVPPSPYAAAGPRAGDDRAAALGGGVQLLNVQVARVEAAPRPPVEAAVPKVVVEEVPQPEPEPEPEPLPEPTPDPEPVQVQVERTSADAGAEPGSGGTQQGVGEVLGIEQGTGRGDGGTEAEGRYRGVPPRPRGVFMPPQDRPRKVRGLEVMVWVFVSEKGVVVPDSTRLVPSTGDGRFDERLRRQAAEWVFQPAQREGKPVAEWFHFEVSL